MRVNTWIGGILELSSKVRYGITTRGAPIFRFIPYDRSLGPFAVGCSQRNVFYNVHAIVESKEEETPKRTNELPKANLVQILGTPTAESELAVLMATYAFDSKKELRKHAIQTISSIQDVSLENRTRLEGITFHIDPPGCKDVDDSFTFLKTEKGWTISINIADVAAYVEEGTPLDQMAKAKATSFYSPTGVSLAPMLPPEVEEIASLLPGKDKLTVSLQFDWIPGLPGLSGLPDQSINFRWIQTITHTTTSYTYDEANSQLSSSEHLQALKEFTQSSDSHKWVETMMILYNTHAGEKLRELGCGILRTHSIPQQEKLEAWTQIDPDLAFLAYDSATFINANTTKEIHHYGLNLGTYAYASSPIRRYCDLVNQRILKGDIKPSSDIPESLINDLNRRQKQAKAFSRDLFFMTALKTHDGEAKETKEAVIGTVVSVSSSNDSFKVYVPVWKRVVKVRAIQRPLLEIKTKVSLTWYDDMKTPFWKDRIVFSTEAL